MLKRFTANFVPTGGVQILFTDSESEAVKAKVKACIMTVKGEIPSQSGIGSDIKKLSFALDTQERNAMISLVLMEDLSRNVREISTLQVSVDETEEDLNRKRVKVHFSFQGENHIVEQDLGE